MSCEELEYINGLTRPARERAIRWGGWLLAGLILMANLVAVVH